MEENKAKVEKLERNIARWQDELNTIWEGVNTDAAEVERRNLKNLIHNAKKEINELTGIEQEDEPSDDTSSNDSKKPKKKKVKKTNTTKKSKTYKKSEKEILEIKKIVKRQEKGRLEARIEKLEDERKNYESQKNRAYKDIYLEYTKSIEITIEELEVVIKEIEEIEKQLEEIENKKQQRKNENRTIIFDKEKTEYTEQQNHEYIKYFHGQGDIVENTRDDRRANDEYFGFEGKYTKTHVKDPISETGRPGEEPGPGIDEPGPGIDEPGPGIDEPGPGIDEPGPGTDEPGPEIDEPGPGIDEPGPNPNLPIKSGLQIYRAVLNEIGYIKGTKAINAHDWLNKFGLIGRAAAAGIRLFTGRKKEIARIEEVLDGLEDEDLELMMDDYITKDNNTRTIIKHKHNDIFLRALKNKLERYREEKEPEYAQQEIELNKLIEKQHRELENANPEQKVIINMYLELIGDAKLKIKKDRTDLAERITTLERGRDEKSLDKADNIIGKTKANRNPDNRKEINELADIEVIKLRADKIGDKVTAAKAAYQMEVYEDSQTEYTYKLNGERKASVGAFEAPLVEVKKVSERRYIAPEILHGVGLATMVAIAQAVNMLGQEKIINEGIENINSANRKTISDLQNTATQATVDNAQKTLKTDALNIQTSGERVSEFVGNFAEQSAAYKSSDASMVALSDNAINQVNGFTPQSQNMFGKLSEIFAKKAEIGETIGQNVADKLGNSATNYYSNVHNLITSAGVDHNLTAILEKSAGELNMSQVELYRFLSELCSKISNINIAELEKIDLDLSPILLTLVPTASKIAQETINERSKNTGEEPIYDNDEEKENDSQEER